MRLSKGKIALITVFLMLLLDQISKIWVKTHMQIGDHYDIFPWFKIYFIENNGMAFGIEIISKLFLTLFRLVASGFIIYYLLRIVKQNLPTGFIICVSLILAGAMGNIFDSIFYGKLFSSSMGAVATFLPEGGGYAPWFYGRVVDMLYFPLFSFYWPDWVPSIGGTEFQFFRPIFNLADSAITVGAFLLIIFYRKQIAKI